MTNAELAAQYYPVLWPIGRLDQLLAAGKLTAEEYQQITGQAPKAGKEETV